MLSRLETRFFSTPGETLKRFAMGIFVAHLVLAVLAAIGGFITMTVIAISAEAPLFILIGLLGGPLAGLLIFVEGYFVSTLLYAMGSRTTYAAITSAALSPSNNKEETKDLPPSKNMICCPLCGKNQLKSNKTCVNCGAVFA
ncbi:MAG: hypothetical protein IK104_11320 [Clostridia bacterium]|nr:hypothetical protein [Clostridia bacterium]